MHHYIQHVDKHKQIADSGDGKVNTRLDVAQRLALCLATRRICQRPKAEIPTSTQEVKHDHDHLQTTIQSRSKSLIQNQWASKDHTQPWPSKRARRAPLPRSCPCSKASAQNWTSTTTAGSASSRLQEISQHRLRKCEAPINLAICNNQG